MTRPATRLPTHPIETESYRILAERLDLSGWGEGPGAVAARIVHATADPTLVDSLVVSESAVDAGIGALGAGAPLLCDVEMVRSGVRGGTCLLGEIGPGAQPTRSAAAMALAADRYPDGAVVAIGCAPTALAEVNRRIRDGTFRPALVVGVPVGFVGAADAKEELLAISDETGVPVIVLRGERGGAAVAAAAINALDRLADPRPPVEGETSLMLIGHGTRSPAGQVELRRFAEAMALARPDTPVAAGYIEFMEPGLDEALDEAVGRSAGRVVATPLVLLGAGHMKDDGPAALARGRLRHPGASLAYARDLGVHPSVLAVVGDRIRGAVQPGERVDAVVVVGRGSSDPDANADLAKVARLLADGRGLATGMGTGLGTGVATGRGTGRGTGLGTGVATGLDDRPPGTPDGRSWSDPPPELGLVEPAFVSLAWPDVPTALDRCFHLGARRIVVVPYFLFTGLLVERIDAQVEEWATGHPDARVVIAGHMGVDDRLVALVWHRFDEAAGGPVHMNCDGCLHRVALPGYATGARP
jgi:precorrin isomerase/sirohydrochlorin ferrochelatase